MTHIRCSSGSGEAAATIRGLLPTLSGLIAPSTELHMHLATSMLFRRPLVHVAFMKIDEYRGPEMAGM